MRRGLAFTLWAMLSLAAAATAQDPADAAWDAGEVDRARELYSERLARDSSDIRALHRLALIHAWSEEWAPSLSLFDQLITLSPANLGARVDRARVLAWKGDLAQAMSELETLLESDPSFMPALEALAQFQSWAGDYDRALSIYERMGRTGAGDPSIQYGRARVLSMANRFDAALAVYDSLLAADPDDMQALLGLGQVLMWSNQLDSAEVVYSHILTLEEDNAEALEGIARAATWRGRLVEAEQRWRTAVETNPDAVGALVGLGQTLRWQGRGPAALPWLERAIELSPGNVEAREQMRWVEATLHPRIAPTVVYEWDSDGNRILTMSGHATWRPVPRTELRLDAYHRRARLVDIIDDTQRSWGATLTTQLQLAPGWRLAGSLGGAAADVAGVDGATTWAFTLAAPRRYRLRGALVARRELLDATAGLMGRRVVVDQVTLNAGTRLGRWALEGNSSVAWFRGLLNDTENRRLLLTAFASRPFTGWLTFAPSLRVFGFSDDLTEGYFDPELFALLESGATASVEQGGLVASLGLAPGLQKIQTDGAIRPAFRGTGTLAWEPRPGRSLSVVALYAANGLRTFEAGGEAADYRYFSITLRGRWTF